VLMRDKKLRLIAIDQNRKPEEMIDLPEIGRQVAFANVENYLRMAFRNPGAPILQRSIASLLEVVHLRHL